MGVGPLGLIGDVNGSCFVCCCCRWFFPRGTELSGWICDAQFGLERCDLLCQFGLLMYRALVLPFARVGDMM